MKMDDQDIKKVLQVIVGTKCDWRLDGSANLRVQGMDVSVRDIDLMTSDEGLDVFRKSLKKLIVHDFFNEKIQAQSLLCNIYGFEVEINSYKREELVMLDQTTNTKWEELEIPILPLKFAAKFYELTNRMEKAELITAFINHNR